MREYWICKLCEARFKTRQDAEWHLLEEGMKAVMVGMSCGMRVEVV